MGVPTSALITGMAGSTTGMPGLTSLAQPTRPSLVSHRTTATTTRTVAGRFFAPLSTVSTLRTRAGPAGRQTGTELGPSPVGISPWLVCLLTTIMAVRTVGGVSVAVL